MSAVDRSQPAAHTEAGADTPDGLEGAQIGAQRPTDAIVQAAAEAASTQTTCDGLANPTELHFRIAEAVVAAVEPLIRQQIADEIEQRLDIEAAGEPGHLDSCEVCQGAHGAAKIARGDR